MCDTDKMTEKLTVKQLSSVQKVTFCKGEPTKMLVNSMTMVSYWSTDISSIPIDKTVYVCTEYVPPVLTATIPNLTTIQDENLTFLLLKAEKMPQRPAI